MYPLHLSLPVFQPHFTNLQTPQVVVDGPWKILPWSSLSIFSQISSSLLGWLFYSCSYETPLLLLLVLCLLENQMYDVATVATPFVAGFLLSAFPNHQPSSNPSSSVLVFLLFFPSIIPLITVLSMCSIHLDCLFLLQSLPALLHLLYVPSNQSYSQLLRRPVRVHFLRPLEIWKVQKI